MRKNSHPSQARFLDFWLLGGASLVTWLVFAIAQYLRSDNLLVEAKIQQVAPTFALLSLVINYPHFMASYHLAYSRGWAFTRQNWLAMILVPVLLVLLYAAAFLTTQVSLFNVKWIQPFNAIFSFFGFGYRLGETADLGTDLLGISVWLMYLTVGWHYSKQVFGCAMVYANYDEYPLSARQRILLKSSVFAVAFYSFCHISLHWKNYSPYSSSYNFMGLPVTEIGIPIYFETAANYLVILSAVALCYGVIFLNYKKLRKWPSANFLVPIVAFYIWWIPLFPQKEYYLMLVPFFHSLQYLPFAYRMGNASLSKKKSPQWSFALRAMILVLVGFAAFDLIPSMLDSRYSGGLGNAVFFSLAFVVFINIHHFFLDSVNWRFKDQRIRDVILAPGDQRRV